MTFYGLLHLKETESSAMNVKVRNFDEQTRIYLRNALSLAKSLRAQSHSFCLLTNRADYLLSLLPACTETMRVEQIEFSSNIPTGARFYSAHFKFDVFKFLSKVPEDYVAFVDIDVLCINTMPETMTRCAREGVPMAYDITAQTPSTLTPEDLKRDLKRIHNAESTGRWYGGEFLCGPPIFFAALSQKVEMLLPAYFSQIQKLIHVGDEMVTSAALEMLQSQGVQLVDAGKAGVISRFWNYPCLHQQPPLDMHRGVFLLHLPSDKDFLARIAEDPRIDWQHIYERYAAYYKSPRQRVKWALRWLKVKLSRPH